MIYSNGYYKKEKTEKEIKEIRKKTHKLVTIMNQIKNKTNKLITIRNETRTKYTFKIENRQQKGDKNHSLQQLI